MNTSTAKKETTKLNLALEYIESGLSVIPIINGEKRPPIEWKKYQHAPPDTDKINQWFGNGSNYELALVCGGVSDGLEVIDIDNHLDNATEVFNSYIGLIKEYDIELYNKLVIESTQSGGYHILYRCEEIEGNGKLATQSDKDGKKKTVIETRGEGGYLLSYPSKGYDLIQNSIDKIPFIDIQQRSYLHTLAKSYDTVGTHTKETTYKGNESSNLTVGDDFNNRGDVHDVLISYGWTLSSRNNEIEYWKRPGKRDKGISATFNYKNSGQFYVFSSNANPLESEKSYNKFALYTYLKHNGDFKEATKDLAKQGYGSQSKEMTKVSSSNVSNQGVDVNLLVQVVEELSFKHNKDIPVDAVKRFLSQLFDWTVNEMNSQVIVTPISENWDYLPYDDEGERNHYINDVFPDEPRFLDDDLLMTVNDFVEYFYSKITGKHHTCNKAINVFRETIKSKRIHPLKDYFISTDGFDLKKWKEDNPIADNPIVDWFLRFHIPISEDQSHKEYEQYSKKLEELFIKWCIMVIQCVFGDRPNDVALVLVGGQNTGKTTALRSLIPPELEDYSKEALHDLADKDTKIAACENLFFFDDEGAVLERANIKTMKGLLSSKTHKVRRPFGRGDMIGKRVMSFMITENNDDFLKDVTGSRRFFVVEVSAIEDVEEVESNMDFYKSFSRKDFWGYAYSLYKKYREKGQVVSFTNQDIQFTAKVNKDFNESTHFDELILQYCLPQDALNDTNKKHLQTTMILEELQKKTNLPISSHHYAKINLGKALLRNGYVKTSNDGVKGFWIGFKQ